MLYCWTSVLIVFFIDETAEPGKMRFLQSITFAGFVSFLVSIQQTLRPLIGKGVNPRYFTYLVSAIHCSFYIGINHLLNKMHFQPFLLFAGVVEAYPDCVLVKVGSWYHIHNILVSS